MSDAELRVELRRDEPGVQAREHEAVDGRRVRISLDDYALTGVGQGETEGVVARGAAVDEKPAALCPISLRRQPLGELKRSPLGIGPDIYAFDSGRDVEP